MYRYTPNNAEATPTKVFQNITIVHKLCSYFVHFERLANKSCCYISAQWNGDRLIKTTTGI